MQTLAQTTPVTLAEALAALLELTAQRVRDGVRSPATLEMQQAHQRWWLRTLDGATPLEAVDELVLEGLTRPRGKPTRARTWGPATLRKRLSTLRAAIELQHRRRAIARVPAFPQVLVPRPPPGRWLRSYGEAVALFNSLPLHRAEWMWLALWTCQHASDVERMCWCDVDLLNGRGPSTMVIRNTKNGYTQGLRVRIPKPLERVLVAKRDRERPRPTDVIVRRWPSRGHTLPAHCRKLGLPELNATGLRHTGATWIVRRLGITPAVTRWLGHTSPEQAARRYAHAMPAQLAEVTEAFESIEHEPTNDNAAGLSEAVARALDDLLLVDESDNDNDGGGAGRR